MSPRVAPYGSWRSPITPDLIVANVVGLNEVRLEGDDVYWLEQRPSEGGRQVIVRRAPDGTIADVTPAGFNARTRVHEYGGGAYAVADRTIFFANFADQRVYRQPPGEAPVPLTEAVDAARLRYADLAVDLPRRRLLAVREDHRGGREAENSLVAIDLASGEAAVLASGRDFFAGPRLDPSGAQLAWLAWDHPNMPWDAAELWLAELGADGLRGARRIAGGPGESVFQPEWSAEGVLHFAWERTGWWNLYRRRAGRAEPLAAREAEFGLPAWAFGLSTYAFLADGTIVCAFAERGVWRLALLREGALEPVELPYSAYWSIRARGAHAFFIGASAGEPWSLIALDVARRDPRVLRRATSLTLDPGYLSAPRPIEFATTGDRVAYGLFYPPHNEDFVAPVGERPPLIVQMHGGPTGATSTALNLGLQFWTSRGFAVLDVDYGGSTGYGRAYRERLARQWGIVDVDDCVAGARFLAERGEVDGARLLIRGGSAGGYTTLAVLTFRDAFRAGASYYGVSDLAALARDTHKFESRYLDSLIGPYPARRDLYDERSPINFTERLERPVIFFQGLQDVVVPPDQAERMVEALRRKGIPVAYLPFAGEQHGFRAAENIKRSLEAELYFYSRVLGFPLGEPIEPIEIENLPAPA